MSLWMKPSLIPLIEAEAFFNAIETEQEEDVLDASDQGLLDAYVPEWKRMRGPQNTQHQTHDFTLDVHTAKVICKTRQTEAFRLLPPHWQRLTTLAAFFHDLRKAGGYPHERLQLSHDPLHPIKVAVDIKRHLSQWGFSVVDVFIVVQLVRYHQVLGRWIIRQNMTGEDPSPEMIYEQAMVLPSSLFLGALLALTEGDIRAVKANDAIFTPKVAEQLRAHGWALEACIQRIHEQREWFCQPEVLPMKIDPRSGLGCVSLFLEAQWVEAYRTDCPCLMESMSSWSMFPAWRSPLSIGIQKEVLALACFVQPMSVGDSLGRQLMSPQLWQALLLSHSLDLGGSSVEAWGVLNPFVK
ncbi:MAG: hypothetical protein HEQ32_02710 [Vampirovibrio sp.]